MNNQYRFAKGLTYPKEIIQREHQKNASVEVVFRDHKKKLLEFIRRHNVLLGAVAWLTDEDIVGELALRRTSILVQKEDFLRPDSRGDKISLRMAYGSLYSGMFGAEIPGILKSIQYSNIFEIKPIRCVGNINRKSNPSFPRMHNKFLIGCEYFDIQSSDEFAEHNSIIPREVWTGSYNFSYNAQASFENAVIICDDRISRAFSEEWSQIYMLSEDLNWSEDWVEPEYYIHS